jgi:hypothetical protein
MAEAFFEDTRLAGIVAPIRDYHFCWQLNRLFHFDFRLNTDIEIKLTKKLIRFSFSVFEYPEPGSSLVHYIYNNKHNGEYLLPEFKHNDYIWLMKGDAVDDGKFEHISRSIRQISGVQMVAEITHEKILHKNNLMF